MRLLVQVGDDIIQLYEMSEEEFKKLEPRNLRGAPPALSVPGEILQLDGWIDQQRAKFDEFLKPHREQVEALKNKLQEFLLANAKQEGGHPKRRSRATRARLTSRPRPATRSTETRRFSSTGF